MVTQYQGSASLELTVGKRNVRLGSSTQERREVTLNKGVSSVTLGYLQGTLCGKQRSIEYKEDIPAEK